MKKLSLLIVLVFIALAGYTQTTSGNSTGTAVIGNKSATTTTVSNQVQLCPTCQGTEVNGLSWLLVFMPIVLLIIVLWIISWSKFDIRESLNENVPLQKTIPNPIYDDKNKATLAQMLTNPANASNLIPTIQISDNKPVPSSSRYAAMITVYFGLFIIACFMSYYMYSYIRCPMKPIDIGALKDIVLALLVGIAPYGFNKLSAGIQPK